MKPSQTLTNEDWLELYHLMRRMRAIEDRATELYHEKRTVGRIYTGSGQEAISVGATYALGPNDSVAPIYRDMGAHLVRGITAREIFAQYMGKVTDSSNHGKDSGLHLSDPERGVTVSMISNLTPSLPVAVGCALAFKLRKENRVAMTFFGDGCTSTGSFHEGVNFAAARKLPIVFICSNNQWALSTPNSKQFALEKLADRALGYGIPGVRVDGNDVGAVYEATRTAVERARAGEGPTFIEALTMRMRGHSVTDPAQYMPKEMVEEWAKKDPIDRCEAHLRQENILTDKIEQQISEQVGAEVSDAVEYADNLAGLPAEEALTNVYAEVPHA
ncbi:MAG: thiamine pyrophosphate-dependent dehydrogenase E1 component subunit alpha [Chloroflexota bacterium]